MNILTILFLSCGSKDEDTSIVSDSAIEESQEEVEEESEEDSEEDSGQSE